MQVRIDPKTHEVTVKPTAAELAALSKSLDVLYALSRVDGTAIKDAAATAQAGVERVLGIMRGEIEVPSE